MSPILPSWMYGDPAEVVERMQLQARAKTERQAEERARHRKKQEAGLTPGVVAHMRRIRIRELVQKAMKGAR